MLTGATAGRTVHAAAVRRYPPNPPETASRQLSVKSCRTIRARPAPSASRTDISRRRAKPRASIRLATFAHPISRNTRAAARSSHRPPAAAPTLRARRVFAVRTRSRLVAGNVAGERAADRRQILAGLRQRDTRTKPGNRAETGLGIGGCAQRRRPELDVRRGCVGGRPAQGKIEPLRHDTDDAAPVPVHGHGSGQPRRGRREIAASRGHSSGS